MSRVIALPLGGSRLSGLIGRRLGTVGSGVVCLSGRLGSWRRSLWLVRKGSEQGWVLEGKLAPWMDSSTRRSDWGLMGDPLSRTMMRVILTVSGIVHLYSLGYMSGDPHGSRFMSYLSRFTFFMLNLVMGDNLMQIFRG